MALSVIQYVELPLGDEKMFEINTETDVQLRVLPCSCTFYVSFMYHISRRFTLLQFFMLSIDLFFLASLDRRGSKLIKVPKNSDMSFPWNFPREFGRVSRNFSFSPSFLANEYLPPNQPRPGKMQGFRPTVLCWEPVASTEFAIAIGRFGPTWGIPGSGINGFSWWVFLSDICTPPSHGVVETLADSLQQSDEIFGPNAPGDGQMPLCLTANNPWKRIVTSATSLTFSRTTPNYLLQLVLHYENVHNKQGLKTNTLFEAPSSAWGLSSLQRDLAQSAELARLAMSSLLWIVTHVPNVKVIHVLCDLINPKNI